MFNINESNTWPASVRGYGTGDLVLGGDNSDLGIDNLPIKDLTDRTKYLYDRLGRFEDVVKITGNTSVVAADKYKLHYINASGNITITMDSLANLQHGAIYPFKCKCPANKTVTIQTTGGQQIKDGAISGPKFYLCDGEEFKLVVFKDGSDDHFVMIDAKGNFDKIGNDDLVRIQPRNSIIANGTAYNRADFQRLWDAINASAIDDTTWLSNIFYRQFFSKGNGSTTFRLPDMRGMFHRGLDLGRAIRFGNLDNTPGSYEADDVKAPADNVRGIKRTGAGTIAQAVDNNAPGDDQYDLTKTFEIFTGLETRPKNVGLIPIIYY